MCIYFEVCKSRIKASTVHITVVWSEDCVSLSSVDPWLLCSPVTGAAFTGSLQDHDQGQCPFDIAPFLWRRGWQQWGWRVGYGQFWVQCVQYVEEGLHINCKATVRSQTAFTGSCSCRTDSRPSCSTSECTASPAGQGHS